MRNYSPLLRQEQWQSY